MWRRSRLSQQRVEPFQLLHDEAQGVVDLVLGLCGGDAALEGQVTGRAIQPGVILQPPLQPVYNVAAVARDMVAGLERVVSRTQGRRVIVELHPHQLRHGLVFSDAFSVAADVLVELG